MTFRNPLVSIDASQVVGIFLGFDNQFSPNNRYALHWTDANALGGAQGSLANAGDRFSQLGRTELFGSVTPLTGAGTTITTLLRPPVDGGDHLFETCDQNGVVLILKLSAAGTLSIVHGNLAVGSWCSLEGMGWQSSLG